MLFLLMGVWSCGKVTFGDPVGTVENETPPSDNDGDDGGDADPDGCVQPLPCAECAWPFERTEAAYREAFFDGIGPAASLCGEGICHGGINGDTPQQSPYTPNSPEDLTANLDVAIDDLWSFAKDSKAAPSSGSAPEGAIWNHHPKRERNGWTYSPAEVELMTVFMAQVKEALCQTPTP